MWVLCAALTAGATSVYLVVHNRPQQLATLPQDATGVVRVSGIPSTVSTPLASLMGLSPVPTRDAPNFTLVDQRGHSMSMASLKGRTVVLEFMDPNCVDICPLVSQEFVRAYQDLGSAASGVVFVAVNVNRHHLQVADVAAFSRAHQLDALPSWHFLTGRLPSLQKTWNSYAIVVSDAGPNADVVHTDTVFFIDPGGHERYVAAPAADYTASGTAYLPTADLASWGMGIALVARSLS